MHRLFPVLQGAAPSAPRHLVLAALLLAPLTACLNVTDPKSLPVYQFGAVALRATSDAGGNAQTIPTAVFFEAYSAGIPDSRGQSNTCVYSTVDTTTQTPVGVTRAGTALNMLVGAGTSSTNVAMPYDTLYRRYSTLSRISYVAGDSAKVSIPGETGGFPASTIAVRLAEPLFPGPVTVPSSGPMTITWNASPDTTSAIIISLKYANPASSTYANEQIICSLKDDGNEQLSASAIAPVLASPAAMRSLLLTRWRTQQATPTDLSLLHIVSVIDTLVKLQ